MPNCDVTFFSSTSTEFANAWAAAWPPSDLSTRSGFAFGSCYTICGSLGVTGTTAGLAALQPNTAAAVAYFTTCGTEDRALLAIPFDPEPVALDTEVRATGLNVLWPSGGPGSELVNATASVSGVALVSVPVRGRSIAWSEAQVSLRLYVNWPAATMAAWPDQASILYEAVPLPELASNWASTMTEAVQATMGPLLQKAIRKPNETLACDFGALITQVCAANTSMPNNACDPCDTCCKCLVQQRCDGECSGCPCVGCAPNTWSNTAVLAVAMIGLFTVTWFLWPAAPRTVTVVEAV